MNSEKDSFIMDTEVLRVDIGNGFEEFQCEPVIGDDNAVLGIGADNIIGVYKMVDSRLYIISTSGEYEIKDWYFSRTYYLKEIMMTQDPGI